MTHTTQSDFDKEFELEAKYLADVYQKMLDSRDEHTAFVKEAKEDGQAIIKKMSDDIRVNFSNYENALDSYSTIEMKNREIEQMNHRLLSSERLLANVERSLEAPYFGKINVDFLDDDPSQDFYIGINSFGTDVEDKLVYDWRSPIAELFYNNVTGPSSYEVNENTLNVEIDNRRQFAIEKNILLKYFDTSVAIQDDVLLEALEQDSSNLMQDITSTIQSEQNLIIRDTSNPIILVNGVAGSGKTSTIMQRIAYLLYSFRKDITSDNILILSPNEHFVTYISNVLPSLGEKTPQNMTLLQFIDYNLMFEVEKEEDYFDRISEQEVDKQTTVIRSKEFIDFIDQSEEVLLNQLDFFEDIYRKDKVIISKDRIIKTFNDTPASAPLVDRIQATKQLLMSGWQLRIANLADKPAVKDRILSLPESLQQKFFNEQIKDDSPSTLKKYAIKYVKIQFGTVTRSLEDLAWVNLPTVFSKIYEAYTNEPYEFKGKNTLNMDESVAMLYIYNKFVEKVAVPHMKFVLVDEVQDYTAAQIRLLAKLFPKSEFTMVGDENQAIFNANVKFDDIIENFTSRSKRVKLYQLINSYRSSGAITKLFSQLATNNESWEIIPIRPDGSEPSLISLPNENKMLEIVEGIHSELNGQHLTIITKTMAEANELNDIFDSEAQETLNIEIIPISLSKGLEFDNVLVYDASDINYNNERDQRILYTASSRAMKNLYITYKGQLTRFLK